MPDENNAVDIHNTALPLCKKSFYWGCLIWAFIGVTLLGILVALLFPARCVSREAARRFACRNNLNRLPLRCTTMSKRTNAIRPCIRSINKANRCTVGER